ncbi:MAG: imidazole glycerol phosphate synthase subunit HisF [Anaerolineae bacterium]|jgi:cyclase
MTTKRIIPCLDIKEGRVVKGVRFVNLRDAGDPVENARLYNTEGADELAFLDIVASPEERTTTVEMVRQVANEVFMPLIVGGGVRSIEDMHTLLLAGADRVSINTAAVHTPELIARAAEKFGSRCVVIAIDAKQVATDPPRWTSYVNGGRTPTGLDVVEWASMAVEMGAGEILLSSIDTDGTLAGYDIALTRTVAEAVSVPVIASGGAGKLAHFAQALTEGKAEAALAATVFHDRMLSVHEVKVYLTKENIPIRMGE